MKLKFKRKYRTVFILALGLLLIANFAMAANKNMSTTSSQNLQKPATFESTIINIGAIQCYIDNQSLQTSGDDAFGFNIGDPTAAQASMYWLEGGYPQNLYLYFGVSRMAVNNEEVHFSGLNCEDWSLRQNDPDARSAFQVSFTMTDELAEANYTKGISATTTYHAWSESYRDDFYIIEYDVTNNSADNYDDFYAWLHMDADISGAAGGSGVRGFWRDDLPQYLLGTDSYGNPEHISYMYDADNPNIGGNDVGGTLLPQESKGFIGSRIIDAPAATAGAYAGIANTQSGHQWWDWNSDPDINDIGVNADLAALTEFKAAPGSPHDYRYMQIIGPLTINAGETIHYALGMGIGEGLEGLRQNLQWAYDIYWNDFQGPAAPDAPTFTVEKGDAQVTITWEYGPEESTDPLTGDMDFEGYRIYRSTDQTNWALLQDYDILNDVFDNAGMPELNTVDSTYTYVDDKAINGFVYYYTVSAYDHGSPGLVSLETGKRLDMYVEPGVSVGSASIDEDAIRVVPNPFIVSADWNTTPTIENPSEERIQFQNVPLGSKVTVFTLAGDKIIELEQTGNEGSINFDLISRSTQKMVSGLYLYVVEAENGDKFIDKFVVIR